MEQNPQKIDQAVKLWNKYPKTKKGMQQAIQDNGGTKAFENAMNVLKTNPIAKFALNGLGLNVDKMANEIKESIDKPSIRPPERENNKVSSLQDRLKKL